MPRPRRPNVPTPTPTRPTTRQGYTKLTLVVPLDFSRRLKGYCGAKGLTASGLVVELVNRNLDQRRWLNAPQGGEVDPNGGADRNDGEDRDQAPPRLAAV